MSVEAADDDAVGGATAQLPQHDVISAGPGHRSTLVVVVTVVVIVATIQHSESIHPYSLLRNVLH